MLQYVVGRLMQTVLVLLGVSFIVFMLVRLVPGDPARLMMPETAPEAAIQEMREYMGLDRPLTVQYGYFMKDLMRGDLGESITYRRPVSEMVIERLPATLQLALGALLVAVILGVSLGILAARFQNGPFYSLFLTITILGQSVPTFWLGILLIQAFAISLNWLPATGRSGPESLILPSVTLGFVLLPLLARLVAVRTAEILRLDYVTTARSKGISERAVMFQHALRNALIPVITVIGVQFGALLGGAVITEAIFTWPGLGRLVLEGIASRDYPVVQGAVILLSFNFILVNFVVDLFYAYLDPRIRFA